MQIRVSGLLAIFRLTKKERKKKSQESNQARLYAKKKKSEVVPISKVFLSARRSSWANQAVTSVLGKATQHQFESDEIKSYAKQSLIFFRVTILILFHLVSFLVVSFVQIVNSSGGILLVFGNQIYQIGFSLREFHLIHSLVCVPM